MSLHPEEIGEVPEEASCVAKACFPKGNRYIRLRDTLGTMFDDHEFADLFPRRGQPAEAPWRLALVCLVQYMEELTDRQTADAVRSRMDIKYLLGLELTDPGFDFRVLSEFRTHLVEHQVEHRLFELLIAKLSEQGYLKKRGSQRTDSTHILAVVHRYHRVELLPETLRAPLNEVAVQAPEWLQRWMPVDWLQRRRKQQDTMEFQGIYAKRAGIEGIHSQAMRLLGLRQCRYLGLQKASLQHSLIAAALNLPRLDKFLTGEKMEQTRISHFAALAPKKAA